MNEQDNTYGMYGSHAIAAEASVPARAAFLKKTYLHLLGAVLTFAALEAAIVNMPGVEKLIGAMVGSPISALVVFGVFLLVSGIAQRMAASATSLSTQYAGLGLFVLLESVIFAPIIYFSLKLEEAKGWSIIAPAAAATLVFFGALTAIVFITRKDFSFLRSALMLGAVIAVGLMVCSLIFGFDLGMIFSVAMVGLMCLWILYDTSNVLHHYHTNQYVVASLALFASLATLFWYVIRIAWYINASRD